MDHRGGHPANKGGKIPWPGGSCAQNGAAQGAGLGGGADLNRTAADVRQQLHHQGIFGGDAPGGKDPADRMAGSLAAVDDSQRAEADGLQEGAVQLFRTGVEGQPHHYPP